MRNLRLNLPAPGRYGQWRRVGEYQPRGRRVLPREWVLALWRAGLSCRQIAERLGPVRGARFTAGGISKLVYQARALGEDVPFHRVVLEEFSDSGISVRKQQALGL